MRGPDYSRDEWIILLHYFLTQPELTHTNSHYQLERFAAAIGRTPGSVDASLRNIKLALTGSAGLEHGSSVMRDVVRELASAPVALREAAIQSLARKNPAASFP